MEKEGEESEVGEEGEENEEGEGSEEGEEDDEIEKNEEGEYGEESDGGWLRQVKGNQGDKRKDSESLPWDPGGLRLEVGQLSLNKMQR
jgi:hypothetical protein